jgi:hypothetical protein
LSSQKTKILNGGGEYKKENLLNILKVTHYENEYVKTFEISMSEGKLPMQTWAESTGKSEIEKYLCTHS